jgi:hypothetical protein
VPDGEESIDPERLPDRLHVTCVRFDFPLPVEVDRTVRTALVEAGAGNRQLAQQRTQLRKIVGRARSAVSEQHARRTDVVCIDGEASTRRRNHRRARDHGATDGTGERHHPGSAPAARPGRAAGG